MLDVLLIEFFIFWFPTFRALIPGPHLVAFLCPTEVQRVLQPFDDMLKCLNADIYEFDGALTSLAEGVGEGSGEVQRILCDKLFGQT